MARIGDMLVAAGFATEAQVEEALEAQGASGRRLGEELIALGVVTEIQLTQTLSNQLSVPWVSLYHVEFSRELLQLVPAGLAERYGLIPVYQRVVPDEGPTLFVAMEDPTDEKVLGLLKQATAMRVKPMVSAPSEIRRAIGIYYLGKPAGASSSPPARASRHPPPSSAPPPEIEVIEGDPLDSEPPGNENPFDAPAVPPPVASGPRFVSLTLLDGTTVRVPGPGARAEEEPSQLTASDLIAALLARSQGADVSDILAPGESWEGLFATLLSLLIRKGLIADWEFVEAWKKNQPSE